jgi:large subunit ribosomal protein L6
MSRIGKKILSIPAGVKVEIKNNEVLVTGPKGKIVQKIHPRVSIVETPDGLVVKVVNENTKKDRALWGTFGSLMKNMSSIFF